MSILDRRPKHYSTSDLFWVPSPAPEDGAVGDINTMKLSPAHLGMVQDMIIDTNGVLRSRGALKSFTSDAFVNALLGATQIPINALNNSGTLLVENIGTQLVFHGSSATALTGFAKLTVSGTDSGGTQAWNPATQFLIPTFAKLPNDAGVVGGLQYGLNYNNWGSAFIWGGNAVTTSDTTAGTAASTIGSKAVVGVGTAWTSALVGCYLYIGAGAAAVYVGQVLSVGSTTTLTLRKGALKTIAAAAPAFKTVRYPLAMVYKGRITANTASAVIIGANTKFNTSGAGGSGSLLLTASGGANLFRYSDGAYIGTVLSVQNDTTLTLAANAAISMVNEEYYMVGSTYLSINASPFFGFSATCVEQYADRFWYGCVTATDLGISATGLLTYNSVVNNAMVGSNSIMFTKKGDAECLDLDPTNGDILKVPTGTSSDVIRGLCATRGGMVVFRGFDTFLLTGYSPETFRLIKILDDGCVNCASYKPYKDGVVWAGSQSVWYFDGTRVVDLLQNKIKRFYRRTAKVPAPTFAAGLAVSNNHILVSYGVTGDKTFPYKNTTKSINNVTLAINMLNGAISFFTNLFVQNGFSDQTTNNQLVLTNTHLVDGDILFQDSNTAANNFDAITGAVTFSSGAQIGPDCMFESIKMANGNAARMKFWKMLLMNYSSDVSMTVSIIGTNDTSIDFPNRSTGSVAAVTFPVSANVGILKRIKFLVRTPAIMIRVYQTSTTSATSQRFKMFWYAVGGKWMRWGRAQ